MRRPGRRRRRRLLRKAKQFGFSDRQLATLWDTQRDGRPRATASAAASSPRSSRSIPAPPSSRPTRRTTTRTYEDEDETPPKQPGKQADHDPRRRAEPHRPGDRVRLLLLPRQLRPARAGHRVGHGQLEPRDGQHRLRHERPAVLRAADDRGRAQHLRPRAARRRDRAVRRADAAEPGPGPGRRRRADHRHERRHDRSGRGPREIPAAARSGSACKQPANGIARTMDEARAEAGEDRLSRARAAELRARRPGDGDLLRPGAARAVRGRGVRRRRRASRC